MCRRASAVDSYASSITPCAAVTTSTITASAVATDSATRNATASSTSTTLCNANEIRKRDGISGYQRSCDANSKGSYTNVHSRSSTYFVCSRRSAHCAHAQRSARICIIRFKCSVHTGDGQTGSVYASGLRTSSVLANRACASRFQARNFRTDSVVPCNGRSKCSVNRGPSR